MGRKPAFGLAQLNFIKVNRAEVDKNKEGYFKERDWRNVAPSGGRFRCAGTKRKVNVNSFYIKPLAVFVPHLLLKNHVPSCPKCESSLSVFTEGPRVKWVKVPKLLFGTNSHKYLDTKRYWCNHCYKSFLGCDKHSMCLDSHQWTGFFPFNLSSHFAVDEEVYNYIICASMLPTAKTQQQLKAMSVSHYHSEQSYYLYMATANKIHLRNSDVAAHDRTQPKITCMMKKRVSSLERRCRDKQAQAQVLRMNLESAKRSLSDGVPLRPLLAQKLDRNNRNRILKGIGVSKLQILISHGLNTAQDVLDCENPRIVRDDWLIIVEAHFENLRNKIDDMEGTLSDEQDSLLFLEVKLRDEVVPDEEPMTEDDAPATALLPPKFSACNDRTGYNGQCLSRRRIESVIRTEFHHRKAMQESKMRSLTATMLKFNFNYKIAKKMRVWTGPGQSFQPYESLLTVQNEYGLTVFWKAIRKGESLDTEVRSDLKKLDRRLARVAKKQSSPVMCDWVDKCCQWRPLLQTVFPNGETKLDAFHWMERFDPLLADTKSREARLFVSLLHRAMFLVTPQEFQSVKDKLWKKKGHEPTTKEVLKKSRSVIPGPDLLLVNVQQLIGYCIYTDSQTSVKRATASEEEKKLLAGFFFKPLKSDGFDGYKLIRQQLSHIKKGCLSDPEDVGVHFYNSGLDIWHTMRGTSGLEADNKLIDELTGNSIGIELADRLLWNFFEQSNDRKRIQRCGEIDYGASKTETLAFINVQAASAGFSGTELPYPDLHLPRVLPNIEEEAIGLDFKFPDYEDVSNPTHLSNERWNYSGSAEEATDNDMAEFLDGMLIIEDEDEEEEEQVDSDALPTEEEPASDNDEAEDERISKADLLQPNVFVSDRAAESTRQVFERLTNQQPWIPFRKKDSSVPATELQIEEDRLFDDLQSEFKRTIAPSHKNGCHDFEKAWNTEN